MKKSRKAHHHTCQIMGCAFVITAVHDDPQVAWDAIRAGESEMRRVEDVISSWKDSSETTRINESSGIQSECVSTELYQIIERSLKISALSAGSFDISGTLSRYYWNFNNSCNDPLPESTIEELRGLINYKYIKLDPINKSVFLTKRGMKIGFGGIGKGYAAERAMRVMREQGVSNGLINASGDLKCWGCPPGAAHWTINIPDPRDRSKNLLSIFLEEGSVVTSGSYENYTIINDEHYSHIINPRTAFPVKHTKNVTVISPNAEFADAMATALSVLPIEEGIELVNKLNGIECIIIDAHDEPHVSNNLNKLL